jgi:hypothetical protein
VFWLLNVNFLTFATKMKEEDFVLLEELGRGSFGVVSKA